MRPSATSRSAVIGNLAIGGFGVETVLAFDDVDLANAVMADLRPVFEVEADFGPASRPDASAFVRFEGDRFTWRLGDDAGAVATTAELVSAVRGAIERHVAEHSPTHVFVHAGVVAVRDRAIVIPGPSLAGKSTAVEAFVRLGAVYYSDEYAALDPQGRVHAFPRPLSRRLSQSETVLRRFEGGGPSLPVGLALFTKYWVDTRWQPERMSVGDAVLATLANTVCARTAPERALDAVTTALAGAECLTGDRGDADEFARDILASI